MSESDDKNLERKKKMSNTFGMFRVTEWAADRVAAKRKRRGLGEIRPRKKHAFKQIFVNGTCLSIANMLVGPLERCRIILQTAPMSTYQHELPKTTRGLIPYIMETQGNQALWRGTMAHVYKQWLQVIIKVTFYDRFKQFFMPYSPSKYSGLDFFFRTQIAALCCMSVSTFFTYPMDLVHTRLAADSTPLKRDRFIVSTFQSFNKTNIDEGRMGLFKGVEFAVASSILRAMFQLPVYDVVKWSANKAGADNLDTSLGQFTQRVGASLITAILLSAVLYPLDTFKRNAQLNGGMGYRQAFTNFVDCTDYVFKEQRGNAGLYRGCSTFFVSQIFIALFQFSAYDMMFNSLTHTSQKNELSQSTAASTTN